MFRNVMYYGDFDVAGFYPKDIPAENLTHLNYAFLDFDADGNLHWMNEHYAVDSPGGESDVVVGSASAGLINAFQELRLRHPNLLIGISVGGWTKSGDFAPAAANPVARGRLVANLIKFVEYNELDFLDIDWEYPGAVRSPDAADPSDEGTQGTFADYANYVTLLQELRSGLAALSAKTGKTYELSIAVFAGEWVDGEGNSGSAYIKPIFDTIDFGNIMTYDMAGSWVPVTMHHTATTANPLAPERAQRSVAGTIDYYLANGAPAAKLDVGVAFYTRGWGGVADDGPMAGSLPGLYTDNGGAPADGMAGIWPYRRLPELIAQYGNDAAGSPNLKRYWDAAALAPYLYSASDKVLYSYDDAESITAKTAYVKAHNLGGIITWMMSQDAEVAPDSGIRRELTDAITNGLYPAGYALPKYDRPTAKLNITASLIAGSQGTELSIQNNEVLVETDQVLKQVEAKHKTLKSPHLTITPAQSAAKGFDLAEIAPGQTVIVPLGPNLSPSDIREIAIEQRIANIPYGRQTIYPTAVQ